MTPRLAFEGVGCRRSDKNLFENMGFALGPGDALLVTGPNGVGKSSLLRLAAGLLEPTEGRIVRHGNIALADNRPALDPSIPLRKGLAYWAAIDGGTVHVALAAVGLTALADVPVRMLSTGQLRRATMARTIAARASIWLLDEPANGLDRPSVEQLEALIEDHRAAGGIVVIATHQPLRLSDAQALQLAA